MARYVVPCVCFLFVLVGGLVGGPISSAPVDGARGDEWRIQSATSTTDSPCPHEHQVDPGNSTDSTVNGSNPDRTERHTSEPRIVELYPNPTTRGNAGEYLVLDVPSTTDRTALENWTITDGHTTAAVPNETGTGRVALSEDPNATRPLTDHPVRELEGTLRLAVDGDELELRNGTETVDRVSYAEAPLAERWHRVEPESESPSSESSAADGSDGHWWPRDATCVPVSSADVDEATAFVLPDSPAVPRETIRNADDRLLVAGYTITSQPVARDLVAAADRGVDVAVLLEASPVGGTPAPTEAVLETLADGGVDVRAIGAEGGRYRYHHPKYAVADDHVMVTSENWKPSGVGGAGSRGWGVRLENATLAADLVTVFRADFEGWDTQSGAAYRRNTSVVEDDATDATSEYPAEHEPSTVPLESAELLVAPDNAETRLAELLAAADEEILVKQASLDTDASVLEPVLTAARRGVEVEILLDSAWYHEDENAAVVDDLEATADREELALDVRLVEETDRFSKIHAKGVVIDREIAVVGSANWNDNAFTNNREVLVALYGDEAAAYYASVFEADWNGETWSLPIGFAVIVVAALIAAAFVGSRYVRFGDDRP